MDTIEIRKNLKKTTMIFPKMKKTFVIFGMTFA